jgi:hypothetical protein
MIRIPRQAFTFIFSLLFVGLGFMWVREGVTNRIYRDKLDELAADYAALTVHYNEAVRRSAVSELEVTEDSLNILVRTTEGIIQRIPTPYDPNREIYVDFLLGNGRIWIRRVFDDQTPPSEAIVIDPVWDIVDWESPDLSYGKAVYRSLTPGLWSIQVSGNGSLSLEPVPYTLVDRLKSAPEVRSYEEIQIAIESEIKQITFKDMLDVGLNPFGD